MNTKILELAEQAGLRVESWMSNPPKPFQILGSTQHLEQFAELIVEECVKELLGAARFYQVRGDIVGFNALCDEAVNLRELLKSYDE